MNFDRLDGPIAKSYANLYLYIGEPQELHTKGMAKRQLEEYEDRLAAIEAIAIEVKAIIHNEDNDETSSAEDPDADKRAYASVFQAWANGKISGTAEEVFEAVNTVLEF